MITTIDSAGRMVIPKSVREAAGLAPGQELQVEYRDGAIVVEATPRAVKLVRKGTLLVAVAPRDAQPLTHDHVTRSIQDLRNQRSRL